MSQHDKVFAFVLVCFIIVFGLDICSQVRKGHWRYDRDYIRRFLKWRKRDRPVPKVKNAWQRGYDWAWKSLNNGTHTVDFVETMVDGAFYETKEHGGFDEGAAKAVKDFLDRKAGQG